jgi:hypothetical protein
MVNLLHIMQKIRQAFYSQFGGGRYDLWGQVFRHRSKYTQKGRLVKYLGETASRDFRK